MFQNLRGLIINHIGLIIVTIAIIVVLYFVVSETMFKSDSVTKDFVTLSDVMDKTTAATYDNKILSGTQVLAAIKSYYNKDNMFVLLFNNKDSYNKAAYRFWVTKSQASFGQDQNYGSKIISSNYNDINLLVINGKTIKTNNKKLDLSEYSNTTSKSYISLTSKYKSVLIMCNQQTVGIAFFAI